MAEIIKSIMDLGLREADALELSNVLQKGWLFNKAREKAREKAAAVEALAAREAQKAKRPGGKFKLVTILDQQQAFEIEAKYGPDALFDRGFHRDMHRLCPETKCADV
jgi:hypothetical protein